MKQLISRRSFMKAAGVSAAAATMALGAPAASACWTGDVQDITILYTNDVHTYIDKQSPKLTYAAIAALKKSYQDDGKKITDMDLPLIPRLAMKEALKKIEGTDLEKFLKEYNAI